VFVSAVSNNDQDVEPDIFGLYGGSKMIDRGWLTSETVVQFKLFGDSVQLWKHKYKGRQVQCMHFFNCSHGEGFTGDSLLRHCATGQKGVRSLGFFIDLIFMATLWSWGFAELLMETSTRSISWGMKVAGAQGR